MCTQAVRQRQAVCACLGTIKGCNAEELTESGGSRCGSQTEAGDWTCSSSWTLLSWISWSCGTCSTARVLTLSALSFVALQQAGAGRHLSHKALRCSCGEALLCCHAAGGPCKQTTKCKTVASSLEVLLLTTAGCRRHVATFG